MFQIETAASLWRSNSGYRVARRIDGLTLVFIELPLRLPYA
jgi:hypothetical protein